jgi:xanthine/uracil permease
MVFAIACAVRLRGFFGRISIFLALIFGTVLSWAFDRVFGMISSLNPGTGKVTEHSCPRRQLCSCCPRSSR